MEPELRVPLEFIVRGTPVSLQAKRAASRTAWKERVRAAGKRASPEFFFATSQPIAVTIFYFPDAVMQGDIDNIVKPVLDALCRNFYRDDHQVERVWVQKFEPGSVFQFSNPTDVLIEALSDKRPLVFIRLTDVVTEGLI